MRSWPSECDLRSNCKISGNKFLSSDCFPLDRKLKVTYQCSDLQSLTDHPDQVEIVCASENSIISIENVEWLKRTQCAVNSSRIIESCNSKSECQISGADLSGSDCVDLRRNLHVEYSCRAKLLSNSLHLVCAENSLIDEIEIVVKNDSPNSCQTSIKDSLTAACALRNSCAVSGKREGACQLSEISLEVTYKCVGHHALAKLNRGFKKLKNYSISHKIQFLTALDSNELEEQFCMRQCLIWFNCSVLVYDPALNRCFFYDSTSRSLRFLIYSPRSQLILFQNNFNSNQSLFSYRSEKAVMILQSYWPIIDGEAQDFTLNQRHLTSAQPSFVPDRLSEAGSAFHVTSNLSCFQAPPGVYFNSSFTVSGWTMFSRTKETDHHMFKLFSFSSSDGQVLITALLDRPFDLDELKFVIDGYYVLSWSLSSQQLDHWFHWAFVLDMARRQMRVFVNGALWIESDKKWDFFGEETREIRLGLEMSSNQIGSPWTAHIQADSKFDEIKIFSKALSDAEVAQDMSAEFSVFRVL